MTNCLGQSLKFDERLDSHPVVFSVADTEEITAMFDIITYKKVCACMCPSDVLISVFV